MNAGLIVRYVSDKSGSLISEAEVTMTEISGMAGGLIKAIGEIIHTLALQSQKPIRTDIR